MRSRSHDEYMAKHYKQNPEYAIEMLNAILDDGEPNELLVVLRQMAKAYGGVQAVAAKAELNSTQIYRTLSAKGNPSLTSLTAILKTMGIRLAVKGIEPEATESRASQPATRVRKKPSRVQANSSAMVKTAR